MPERCEKLSNLKIEMKKTIIILSAMAVLSGCAYNELPPKTDDITTSYVLPKGEIPTAAERSAVASAKAEYENAIKK